MTSVLPFASAAEITPELLDAALVGSRFASGGPIVDVAYTPIGTGQMAQSVRLDVTFGGSEGGTGSLVAKFPSADAGSRRTGKSLRAYEVEVGFYRDLARSIDCKVPECYFAAIDPDSHDFVLLLEDLAPAQAGDQIVGCGADVAERVLREAVGFHAPQWGDPALEKIGWLNRTTPESALRISGLVASLYPAFLERFGDRLDAEVLATLDAAMPHIGSWWAGFGGARTLFHGDFRLDNLLISSDSDDMWVVDWQTLVLGNGVADIAYFIGGNLLAEVRRPVERELVTEYHRMLCAAGVGDLSFDECWLRYRHGAWHGVFLTVAASMLVEQTERGDTMFVTDMTRHAVHASDLDAIEAIESVYRNGGDISANV